MKNACMLLGAWLCLAGALLAQQPAPDSLLLQGRVLDLHSKLPVPYASLRLPGSRRGAIARQDGHFYLWVLPPQAPDFLILSSIGYQPDTLPLNQLLQQQPLELFLRPLDYQLPAVSIIPPAQILLRAYSRSASNTPPNCRITSFYDAKQTTKDSLMFHTQTILYHEVAEGVPARDPWILQRRNLLVANPYDSSDLYLFMRGLSNIYARPLILNCPSINANCLKKLKDITLEAITLYEGDRVYVIRYDWKHPNNPRQWIGFAGKKNLSRVRLYIRASDFAILRDEHMMHFSGKNFRIPYDPAGNNTYHERLKLHRLIRTYRPYQGTWYPAYISARLEGELKLPIKSEVQPYVYELELSTLSIDPTGDALPAGTYWGALNSVPYRPAFWRQFDSRQR